MFRLLVVDHDRVTLDLFRYAFGEREAHLVTAATGAEGLEIVKQFEPDVVALDVKLPDCSGLDLFRRIHEIDARIPVIFVTADDKTDSAIAAMKLGAYDYVLKYPEPERLHAVVRRAAEVSRLMRVPAVVGNEAVVCPADVIVGRCPAMHEVYKAIGRVAPQDVTVLILGESGTGKELVARAIYQHSRRASAPFLAINCAAIPETLLESELFGHEKGAFTGAERTRIGKFEQCSGGTLFLDEVGDMSPLTQTKVLRVIQDQQFERVGGSQTVKTDVRLIAATNQDLLRLVAAGRFRSDLYYRLSVFVIRLPPLRERIEDLPLLVQHYLNHFNHEFGKAVRRVDEETMRLLKRHPWPGNIRELQSVLKQALLRATGPVLLPEFLPPEFTTPVPAPAVASSDLEEFVDERLRSGTRDLYAEAEMLMERLVLPCVLRHTGGNQLRAAEILGITPKNLRRKMRALGLAGSAALPGKPLEAG